MRKTIMTVDDAATMRKTISFTLNEAGNDVLEAAAGAENCDAPRRWPIDPIITVIGSIHP